VTRPWALVLVGAVLTVLAYPPFHLFVPSFIALVPLYVLLDQAARDARPARAGGYGLAAGLAANGALYWWMPAALRPYTAHSALAYGLVVVLLSLYWGLFSWWVVRTWIGLPRVPRWLVFAGGWTTMEWLFGHHGAIAFPWLGLGTSLTGFPAVVQWADVAGARGVTFWLAAANALVAVALISPVQYRRSALAVIGSVILAFGYGAIRTRSLETHVAGRVLLVQSNEKLAVQRDTAQWSEAVAGLADRTERAVAALRPDLVLWPEAALHRGSSEDLEVVQNVARRVNVPIVVGALEHIPGHGLNGRPYNSAVLIDPGSHLSGAVYRKRHLVPVAERGAIQPGADGVIMRLPTGTAAGVVICYEVAFEGLARAYRRRKADVLLNLSNDAWAGRTNARSQHTAHLVMRAIETRMGVARVANTGPSLVVDPLGRVTARTSSDVATSLTAELATSTVTPWYVRMGDWVALAAGAVVLGLTGVLVLSSRRGRPDGRGESLPRGPAHR